MTKTINICSLNTDVILKRKANTMKRLHSPLDVQIELTEACNQTCRHCYNYWRQGNTQEAHGELARDSFINILRQIHSAKVGTITLTGGEPMLRKDLLFDVVYESNRLGIDTGLNSNGCLIKDLDAKTLDRNGLSHALISVLGPEEVHNFIAGPRGSFQGTINGIKNLVNAGIDVAVNMPISKINLHAINETAKLINDIGIKKFCSGPVIPSCKSNIPLCLSAEECKMCLRELMKAGSEYSLHIDVLEPLARCLFSPGDEKEFVRFFGNRICSAAVSSCAISSKGEMRPCIHSDVIYGNVLPENFLDVWEKMKDWSSPEILPKKCIDCEALIVCGGGCRMSAKVTSGSYKGQDMYMTEPISDPERVSIMPSPKDTQQWVFNTTDLFSFNKRCIIREEDGGHIVYINGRFEYLTPKGFQFLSIIKEAFEFSIASLFQKTGHTEEELEPVIRRLFFSDIIKRKEV